MKGYNVLLNRPSVTWVTKMGLDIRIDADYYSSLYLEKELIEQNNELKYVELGNLGVGFSYGTPPYGHLTNEGVPYLRITNIEDEFFLNDKELAYIDKEYHLKNMRNEVREGDILFRIKGQLGQALVVPKRYSGSHTGSSFLKFTPINIDSYFLILYLSSSFGKNQILRKQSNSIIKYLNIDDIKSIKIPLPSREIQKYIGDKVRRAEELREEARRLIQEVKVILEKDFNLNKEEINEAKFNWVLSTNVEDRIDPNFYQKRYLKLIDKLGNDKEKLSKFANLVTRKYKKRNKSFYIEISNINTTTGLIENASFLNVAEIPTSAKYEVKEGEILVSLVRPTRKAVTIVTREYDNSICTGGFAVLKPKDNVTSEFLLAVLRTDFVTIQFERYCAGSTYPTINKEDVLDIYIPKYTKEEIDKITEIYEKIVKNISLSKELIQQAKQDVEDLIEGKFDMSKLKESAVESG